MDLKSKKNSLEKKRTKNPFVFIGELKEELKKVSWTTKADLISATKIVVVATFIFGIGIYIVDLGIQGLLGLVKQLVLMLFA